MGCAGSSPCAGSSSSPQALTGLEVQQPSEGISEGIAAGLQQARSQTRTDRPYLSLVLEHRGYPSNMSKFSKLALAGVDAADIGPKLLEHIKLFYPKATTEVPKGYEGEAVLYEGLADFLIRLPDDWKQMYKQRGDAMGSLMGKGGVTILDLLQLEGYEVVTMLAPGFGGTAADSRREVLLRKAGSGASLEGKSRDPAARI